MTDVSYVRALARFAPNQAERNVLTAAADEIETLRAALKPAIELAEGLEAHFRENPESEWAMVTREEAEDLRRAAAAMKGNP